MYHSTVLLVVSGSAMCAVTGGRPGIGWLPHIGVSSVWGSPGMPSLVILSNTKIVFLNQGAMKKVRKGIQPTQNADLKEKILYTIELASKEI